MSRELREFLSSKRVASTRATSYKPDGNGQACREKQWRDMESSYYEFEIQEPTTQELARCPP